ncbi:transcription antitermination factor NusB [Thiotrichales bacterium 19S9-12]|nr:transcription antitermination factor NusB [Thiotrichales bacterium 19S9-11]MCF6810819.1 transcription antitermination factor NusB [Thiotrichales bacterium 19S9-12]
MSIKVKQRQRARFHAVQALYQREISGIDYVELRLQFYNDNVERHPVDWDFFHDLLQGVERHQIELDDLIKPLVDRNFEKVNPVELSILRLAAYELCHRLEIPYQVIINEYVDQAKSLGATDGHRFVNGLLDRLNKKVRQVI